MNPFDHIVPMRKEELQHVPAAQSTLNRFAGVSIPQHPSMAPNDFGSPHQDSWCSESVSLNGPVDGNLLLIEQYNPFGYTPNMVCNSNNQMVGVSFDYASSQFWVVVFDENCNIISATPAGKYSGNTFGGGYFYMDNHDNTIVVQNNRIVSYPTANVQLIESEIYPLAPNWRSANIVKLVTGSREGNSLYSSLPVWDESRPNLYWCLLAGEYDYQNYPDSTLSAPAWMAVVQIEDDGSTTLIGANKLEKQWNNNTFAVDENGAYIVTNGLDSEDACTEGYLWAFSLEGNDVTVRWKTPYKNAGYLKPGQKNIGSGTTPTLTKTQDGTELVGITDNADPRLNVLVCNRADGSVISETPCFLEMKSADEASLIGVGDTFVVENNFGHYPTWPFSQLVPNAPGMEMIRINPETAEQPDKKIWSLPDVHFYAMNMLCRGSGIIFAHTCSWSDEISASKGGMYYISAIDSFDGRVIWQIPLGRGVNYCHEYGGIYFNRDGDLYIGTNQYLVAIKNFQNRSQKLKERVAEIEKEIGAND
ncbi:hypothetical protein QPK13_06940 [Photorhabdus tasmaniensis]|uniref:hypothetical protein n=1 Tax=Photorhabdus sp. RM323S TaxID=3342828 RepID=UPI0036DAEAF6